MQLRRKTMDNRYRRDHEMAYYADASVIEEQLAAKKAVREYNTVMPFEPEKGLECLDRAGITHGEDVYFDMQITNDDPTSDAGRQTVVLIGCNIDGGVLAKFDADGEYLDEDMDFTFEDFKIPEGFTLLKGMV